ncbi:MAG TPA: hypothetical protein VGK17_25025 [Propionicimonas sp.]|jgi:hypothetical protein
MLRRQLASAAVAAFALVMGAPAAAAVPAPLAAAACTGFMFGTVREASVAGDSPAPLEGVEVQMVAIDDDGPFGVVAAIPTDADGTYRLDLPCGTRLVVRAVDPLGLHQPSYGGSDGITDWRYADTFVIDQSQGWGQDVVMTPPSLYVPVTPTRVLDTRDGLAPLRPGRSTRFTIPGLPDDVTAVTLNLTTTQATAWTSFVTAMAPSYWADSPYWLPSPKTSSINTSALHDVANLVTVPVGPSGMIEVYNDQGTVHLVADLEGYYSTAEGAGLVPVSPVRALDTRQSAPLGPRGTRTLDLAGPTSTLAVPDGVVAVAVTLTSTRATAATSFISAYPSDADDGPSSSVLNAYAGWDIPNLAVVPLGADGAITLYNDQGTTDLVVDVVGWFVVGSGAFFQATTPERAVGSGLQGPGETRVFTPESAELTAVPDTAVALALNITTSGPTVPSYLTTYQSGTQRPLASNANSQPGADIAAATFTAVDPGFSVYNNRGTARVLVDVWGYFVAP